MRPGAKLGPGLVDAALVLETGDGHDVCDSTWDRMQAEMQDNANEERADEAPEG